MTQFCYLFLCVGPKQVSARKTTRTDASLSLKKKAEQPMTPEEMKVIKLAGILSPKSSKEEELDDPPIRLKEAFSRQLPSHFYATTHLGGADKASENARLLKKGYAFHQKEFALGTISKKNTAMDWWRLFAEHVGAGDGVLDYDFSQSKNRAVVINLTLMFLTFVTERTKSGASRQAEKIQGETPKRYFGTVVQAHKDLGIDLSYALRTAKAWAKGYENDYVSQHGVRMKKHKAGFTRKMMQDMFQCLDRLYKHDPRFVLVLKTGMMTAFTNELRRSEFLEKKKNTFNGNKHLSRANLSFYNKSWKKVDPSPFNLKELQMNGGWLLFVPPTLKNDPRGNIFGDSPTPFPLGSLGKTDAFIDFGAWILRMELDDPLLIPEQRRRTALLVDPGTHEPLSTYTFDKVLIILIQAAYCLQGVSMTEKEARALFGIHSFRVGGDNAHKKAGTPKHFRKHIGHWLSDVIDQYSRAELETLAGYVMGQDVDCQLLQVQDELMPTYPEALEIQEPAFYKIQPESQRIDPDLSVKAARYAVAAISQQWVGRSIRKNFQGLGTFEGQIVSFDKWYKVKYADGDIEEFTRADLRPLLLPIS